MNLYNGDLFVFCSTENCIYRISKNQIKCYETSDTSLYLDYDETAESKSGSGASIEQLLKCGVVIRKPNGELLTLFDYTDEYNALIPEWKRYIILPFILLAAIVVYLVAQSMERNKTEDQ